MKKMMSLMVFVVALGLSSVAYAQSGIHITIAGSENNGTDAYIGIAENPNRCAYGGVYFYDSAVSKALAVALTAKVTGKTVQIDYSQPGGAGTKCVGISIYLE